MRPIERDSLEVWEFVNTTVDAHPIHLHLVQFQVLNRQPVDAEDYLAARATRRRRRLAGPGHGALPCAARRRRT